MKKLFLVPVTIIFSLVFVSVNAHEHMKEEHSDSHHHEVIMISDDLPIPSIDLIVHEDSLGGWNLEIKLNNFEFAPEMINQKNEENKGHAHLYINGEKITRIYGNWFYLKTLPLGKNEIKVSLNTNTHQSLMYQGQLIEDTEIIEVK